jgi:hypothetical protein
LAHNYFFFWCSTLCCISNKCITLVHGSALNKLLYLAVQWLSASSVYICTALRVISTRPELFFHLLDRTVTCCLCLLLLLLLSVWALWSKIDFNLKRKYLLAAFHLALY